MIIVRTINQIITGGSTSRSLLAVWCICRADHIHFLILFKLRFVYWIDWWLVWILRCQKNWWTVVKMINSFSWLFRLQLASWLSFFWMILQFFLKSSFLYVYHLVAKVLRLNTFVFINWTIFFYDNIWCLLVSVEVNLIFI